MNSKIENLNIISQQLLPTPEAVKNELPLSAAAEETVLRGREAIEGILSRTDPRLLLVVGPCAIHDLKAGLEYAARLRKLADEVSDTFVLVMRVYFEKP